CARLSRTRVRESNSQPSASAARKARPARRKPHKEKSHGESRSPSEEKRENPQEAGRNHRAAAADGVQVAQARLRPGGGRLDRQDVGVCLVALEGAEGPKRRRQEGRREARGQARRGEGEGGEDREGRLRSKWFPLSRPHLGGGAGRPRGGAAVLK